MDYTVAEAFSWFISLTWWHAALLVVAFQAICGALLGSAIGLISAVRELASG